MIPLITLASLLLPVALAVFVSNFESWLGMRWYARGMSPLFLVALPTLLAAGGFVYRHKVSATGRQTGMGIALFWALAFAVAQGSGGDGLGASVFACVALLPFWGLGYFIAVRVAAKRGPP